MNRGTDMLGNEEDLSETDGDLTALAGASSGLLDDDDVALVATEIMPAAAKAKVLGESRDGAGPAV